MKAFVFLGALTFVSTELLSALDALTRPALFGLWITVAAVMLVKWRPRVTLPREFWWWPAAGFVLAILAIAAATPPNTVDAMTYHMPRIMMWLQNQSAVYFPTTSPDQLFKTPGAEYIQLHLVGLTHSDRFASIAHALAYAASGFAAAQLAARAGGSPAAQALAAAFCLSIPQGALTASGAKNDWFLALWMLVSACFTIDFIRAPTLARSTWLGLSMGLAVTTKGTAFAFLPCLALLWPAASPGPALPLLARRMAPALIIPALFLLPTVVRNMDFFGSPLTPPVSVWAYSAFGNTRHSPDVLLSNAVRNLALHTPGIPAVQQVADISASAVFQAFDIDPHDPSTTWPGTRFAIAKSVYHEAAAANSLHLLLVFASILLMLSKRFRDRPTLVLVAIITAMAFCFCLLLRWQPWHSRLHLPIFAFGSVLIALQMSRIRPAVIIHAVTAFCLLWTANAVARSVNRPAMGGRSVFTRPAEELLFFDRTIHADGYTRAAAFVKATGCRDIGLDSTNYQFDYPFFALLGVLEQQRTLRYAGVANVSTKYQKPEWPEPCALICLECTPEQSKRGFTTATQFPGLVLYTRSPVPSHDGQRD